MYETSKMWVLLKIRGGGVNLLLLARERSRGLLFREGFRDMVVTIRVRPSIAPG